MKKNIVATSLIVFLVFLLLFSLIHRRPLLPQHSLAQTTDTKAKNETATIKEAAVTPVQEVENDNPRKKIFADKVVALIYHHIDEHEIPGLVISPQRFRHHLDMLRAAGYRAVGLQEMEAFLNGKPIPNNAVLITFDDGYESVYRYALPELKARHMPALSFAIVGYMGQKLGNLQHYNWQQAAEMASAGFITQSHTYNLHDYALLANGHTGPLLNGPLKGQNTNEFQEMVRRDLQHSRELIEANLHYPAVALALPFGAAGSLSIKVAAETGFKFIFTTRPGAITRKTNPLYLPRINAGTPNLTTSQLDNIIRKTAGEDLKTGGQ
ncbi:polysaccharide deacetylase family protein [Neomoorella humiferrea]|uniref:polysaccharide deacetylase family protein n=1 Tax=Neomoorella humiferrea TaxID=676965 RepID=UPI003D8C5DEE